MLVEHFEKSPGYVRFDVFREWWNEPGDSPFPVTLSCGSFFLVLNLLCVPEIFKTIGLKITIEASLKTVNFLDVTLNLDTGLYQPYRKPNDQTRYVNAQSNHPPAMTKNLPKSIEQR